MCVSHSPFFLFIFSWLISIDTIYKTQQYEFIILCFIICLIGKTIYLRKKSHFDSHRKHLKNKVFSLILNENFSSNHSGDNVSSIERRLVPMWQIYMCMRFCCSIKCRKIIKKIQKQTIKSSNVLFFSSIVIRSYCGLFVAKKYNVIKWFRSYCSKFKNLKLNIQACTWVTITWTMYTMYKI